MRTTTRAALSAAALALVVAGCSGPQEPPQGPPGAAEPREPRAQAAELPGQVIDLPGAGRAEGVVLEPETGLLVVAVEDPSRLALVARDGTVSYVPSPGGTRHLSLGEPGTVLVPSEGGETLEQLDLTTKVPTWSLRTGEHTHDAALGSGGVVISTSEFGASVLLSRAGTELATLPGPDQPGGAAAQGSVGAVLDVRGNRLHLYDLAAQEEADVLDAGVGPTHLAFVGPGLLAAADTDGDQVLLYDVTNPSAASLVQGAPLPGGPYGIAFDATRDVLWVASSGENRALAFRVEAGELTAIGGFDTVSAPYSLAVDASDGSVWVASEDKNVLQHVQDPLG